MTRKKQYSVGLFQPYLRNHILNFGRLLKFGVFDYQKPKIPSGGYAHLPSFDKEVLRTKTGWIVRLRRLLGVPNVRIRRETKHDMLFTYGCLLITNRPYCTYIETGLALYNYDLQIARHPVARFIVSWLATRANCKQLIFMSQASKKSFFATVHYPAAVRRILERKSCVVYPIVPSKMNKPKQMGARLKLLFPGTFYIKGGMEVVHAFERLRQLSKHVELTIITAVHMLRQEDRELMSALPGLALIDAKLSEQEMVAMYESHDIFLLPTFREGFGLVGVEALSYGLPIIATDQYAVAEMVEDGRNGFLYPNHPLKDYDPSTYRMLGRYHNPKDFYTDLFRYQRQGTLKPVEDFLVRSIEQFLKNPTMLEQYSKASLELYRKRFDAQTLSDQIEHVFLDAVA